MWISIAWGTLCVLAAISLGTAFGRCGETPGPWAPPDAPRHADGTPDYPAIGRAILAEAEAGEDEGPSFCPACLAVAREHGETQEPIGEPDLCQKHMERLIGWTSIEPHSMGRIVGGMLNYAARTTEAGRRE